MKKLIVILILFGAQTSLSSQEVWKLSNCVQYAIEHNISLNQAYNKVAEQEINLTQSKANILPSLNMGSDVYLNYGRGIDENNNVTFDQKLNNSYWIQSTVSLFRGLVKYNTVAFNRYLLSAQEQGAIYEQNRLVFQVMTNYYMVLYSEGLANVAQKQVDLSYMQFNRMQKLVDVGKESPITVQNLKSQWANDKLSLTQAKNNANNTLLDLKQLLRIGATESFELDTLLINSLVVIPLLKVDSVFNTAKDLLPEIKQGEYLLNAVEKDLAVAKGSISPQLYLSAGFYTDYFDANREDQVTDAYRDQLKNNQSQWVSLGISVPLFNGASTYSKIKRKQIAVIDQSLQLEKQKDDLYAEIWKAINDLQSAENEYQSSQELYDFSQLDFENMTMKLEKGMASATDYEVAKQRFVSAEASLLKSKLIYMMRNQMLQFYTSGDWGHL